VKQCRIMITKKCNLKCSYCLMKNDELMATFKPVDLDTLRDIVSTTEYSAYCITGGEPLMNRQTIIDTLKTVITLQKYAKKLAPVYLYTNGEHKINEAMTLIYSVNGLNISPHKNVNYNWIKRAKMLTNIRIHRQDIKTDAKLIHFCADNHIPLKIWHKDDCKTVPEDRFILKEVV